MLRERGWRVYSSESVTYDRIIVREVSGETVTRHVKLLRKIERALIIRIADHPRAGIRTGEPEMDAYIIVRQDGKFVAVSGLKSSYTRDVGKARLYAMRSAAEADRCPENEYVVSVIDRLRAGNR